MVTMLFYFECYNRHYFIFNVIMIRYGRLYFLQNLHETLLWNKSVIEGFVGWTA